MDVREKKAQQNAMINIQSINTKDASDVQKLYYETHEASKCKNGEQEAEQ